MDLFFFLVDDLSALSVRFVNDTFYKTSVCNTQRYLSGEFLSSLLSEALNFTHPSEWQVALGYELGTLRNFFFEDGIPVASTICSHKDKCHSLLNCKFFSP